MMNETNIAKFLEGRNQKKYIVNVEVPYYDNKAQLVINDPINGKYISSDTFKPFIWFKEEITKIMYEGKRSAIKKATDNYGVTITKLKTRDNSGYEPSRLSNGYKYIATIDGSYSKLLNFFKKGGVDVFSEEYKKYFVYISPVEQYLIASGRRLFKGMEDYDDIHRLQFDLETTGLYPRGQYLSNKEIQAIKLKMGTGEDLTNLYEFEDGEPVRHKDAEIFQVGIKDNRGFQEIIEVRGNTVVERNRQEMVAIIKFFKYIDALKPDIIGGYNSDDFDWPFIFERCKILGLNIETAAKTLDPQQKAKIYRVDKRIKLGGETQDIEQTMIWGFNIVDVSHAVRKAKAIDSNIKRWGLKYITKHSELNKKNRVYVEGNKIHEIWADTKTIYAFNNDDGDYYKISDETPLKDGYVQVKGDAIIRRYLLDDLWETEKVDERYNQASFLLSKIIPTSYMRSTTMGTAGIWKLIMLAWSYENRLAIPDQRPQKSFTGGLSRLLEVGYAKNVCKLDYAALYPNIELTHDIFPDVDITGVMKGMLLYIASTRDEYKDLKNKHGKMANDLSHKLNTDRESLNSEQIKELEEAISRNKSLESLYDKKQLPIKILGNSFFGSLGAPHIFNWGDTDCAEETTCRARQYLRLMVKFFVDKGFRPLVGDTDGFNFATPDNVEINTYTPKGTHRFTEKDKDNELKGLEAVVAEFNELYMIGRMGLDIDDICESTINFSRKNYANLIKKGDKLKVKLVGNTIKSSKMPGYIEEFIEKGCELLLYNKGYEFVQLYNETVDKIFNYQIPLLKIASKANVKHTIKEYKADMLTKTKTGSFKAKKAHMELLLANNIPAKLGETIYYVNTGTAKSHGDCKVVVNKETGEREVVLQSKMISNEQLENNPDLTTDEYNVAKYLGAFNTRIHPLLVCFRPGIREKIVTNVVKDKKNNLLTLTDIEVFTKKDCILTSGHQFGPGDQDDYTIDLMNMEDKEIEFWLRVDEVPNNIEDLNLNWDDTKNNYFRRKAQEQLEGIELEKLQITNDIKQLEVAEYKYIIDNNILPKRLSSYAYLNVLPNTKGEPEIYVSSIKWSVPISSMKTIEKYQTWANERKIFYMTLENSKDRTHENWLRSKWRESIKKEEFDKASFINKELELIGCKMGMEDAVQ
tara:strand:- start:4634 stop:8074 length:3441 start_codon:yes stop_codon:yes gene_type:complete